jgi:aminoglycoside phosphotransferase (APT) family kinase protein
VVTAALEAAGRLLSDLHARREPAGRQRSLTDDADELVGYLPAAERISPVAAAGLAAGIVRLRAVADPSAPTVASHGAFRLDQVLMTDGGPKLIDLDSYCWAEPARDIGNLLAYLRWRAIRRPSSKAATEAIGAAFLAGYDTERRVDAARVAVHQASSLLKIAGRRYRALAMHEWEFVPALIDAALELLAVPARSAR